MTICPPFDPRRRIWRWTAYQKYMLCNAIEKGDIGEAEAMQIHEISREELDKWRRRIRLYGPSSLMIAKRRGRK